MKCVRIAFFMILLFLCSALLVVSLSKTDTPKCDTLGPAVHQHK